VPQSREQKTRAAIHLALFTLCAAVHPLQSQEHQGHAPAQRLGTVLFANSGAPAAQVSFLRGIALLHSYEYFDARAAFSLARQQDPRFVLAAWCEALAHSQFDWGTEDLPAARAVLAQFAPTRAARISLAGTSQEREFGAAVEAFLDDGALLDRARGFASAMHTWATNDSLNPEALAFAARGALYVLRYAPASERTARAEDAIALAERVVAAAPDHPGGWHYLIHATDSPRFAKRGLAAARRYDSIAPDADHALHMPSHIFLQLGMWNDVVRSNTRAWAASRASVAAGKHPLPELGWHSLQWLQYGLLQQGRFGAARALIDTARTLLRGEIPDGYPDARYTLDMLRFQYAMETGDWQSGADEPSDPASLLSSAESAPSRREQGMAATAAYHLGVVRMMQRADSMTAHTIANRFRAIAAPLPAGQPRRESVVQMANTLSALIIAARSDFLAAAAALNGDVSAAREPGMSPIGPPNALIAAELSGCWLLESGHAREAHAMFSDALQQFPGRRRARLGLAAALKARGDVRGARALTDTLQRALTRAGAASAAMSAACP
jgi:tetratricopeptide (TPR) repeat protein